MQLNPKPQPPGSPAGRPLGGAVLLVLLLGLLNGCLGGISGDLSAKGEDPGDEEPLVGCKDQPCVTDLIVGVCSQRVSVWCSPQDMPECVTDVGSEYDERSHSPECKLQYVAVLQCQLEANWLCDDQSEPRAPACAELEDALLQSCRPTPDASAADPVRSNDVP